MASRWRNSTCFSLVHSTAPAYSNNWELTLCPIKQGSWPYLLYWPVIDHVVKLVENTLAIYRTTNSYAGSVFKKKSTWCSYIVSKFSSHNGQLIVTYNSCSRWFNILFLATALTCLHPHTDRITYRIKNLINLFFFYRRLSNCHVSYDEQINLVPILSQRTHFLPCFPV